VDVFRPFAEGSKTELGWGYFARSTAIRPHVTAPKEMLALLETIVVRRA
jgi:hypothetical protein